MKKTITILCLLIFLTKCRVPVGEERNSGQKINIDNTFKVFSTSVRDTFSIFVRLPFDYTKGDKKTYPVIYLLDANLYFDIIAATLIKYSEVGLLPPAILVGIGYKDFQTMDSLRTRDYTYPIAIPEYEMSVSGQADKFLSFITDELIPEIDKKYPTDKNKRVVMGHSLGGYFGLYAMQENLSKKSSVFSSYIVASPSTHYNHNYILDEFENKEIETAMKTKAYIAFGGLEDEEEDTTIMKTGKVMLALEKSLKNKVDLKCDIYSNLGHMDTPLPAFIKGLQWTLSKEQ